MKRIRLPVLSRLPFLHRASGASIILIISLALASCVRLYSLGSEPLEKSECFSWRMAQFSPWEITQHTVLDTHPPLSYLALKCWFGLWGESPFSLRAFSAFWGILVVLLVYLTVAEISRLKAHAGQSALRQTAASFAAFVCSLHMSEVNAGRFGRMYSLGLFLAGLSAFLLLRALSEKRNWVSWWTAYGLSVAAFCYTHNYAFFTVFAQTLFVVADTLVRWRATCFRQVRLQAGGFLYAAILALILYAPWIPVLRDQARAVHETFWIPQISWREIGRIFFVWGTGMPTQVAWDIWVWAALLASVVGLALPRGGRAFWFLLIQASTPWLMGVGISLLVGRCIFLERYLVFAHFSLMAFWGWLWLQLPGWPERILLISLISGSACVGIVGAFSQLPIQRPSIEMAAQYLQANLEPRDLIVVDAPPTANCLHCYLIAAGVDRAQICTFYSNTTTDVHLSHAAALRSNDLIDPESRIPASFDRIWLINVHVNSFRFFPKTMGRLSEEVFQDQRNTRYTVALYARK